MSIEREQAEAWAKVSQMATTLGWHKDWTPDISWVDYIIQKMAWGEVQSKLREKEFNERMEALRG